MWVDDTAGDDPTGNSTGTDDMTITVGEDEYSAEVNFDIDEDGVQDTAVIERDDGSTQAFVDEDGDGEADGYLKLDADGNLIAEAEYDEAGGEWVSTENGHDTGGDTDTRTSSGGMTADMPSGEVAVGQPTVDTNDDGVADTAVVEDGEGNTMMFTDVDGDGEADVAVVITSSGDSTTYEHSGDGEWTEIDSPDVGSSYVTGGSGAAAAAGVGSDGSDGADGWGGIAGWGGSDSQHVAGVAHIDPATGQWISPN